MKRSIAPLCLFWLLTCSFSAAADKKPNVLFLFADDQRTDTIAALGNPAIQTPNLDTLARSGFVFQNAYCLGSNSGAVCLPSRNMLLSGRAYFRWQGPQAPASGPNFARAMKEAGYETYHHGKRGNTALEIQATFDHNKYLQDNEDRTSGEPGQRIVDEAIAFLNERGGERPFFMYLAFANPHDPRVADKKYLDLYQRSEIPLPKNYRPLHPFDNGEQLVRDEKLAPWPRTEEVVRQHLHDYYAVMTAMDGHIGRLLESLKRQGQYENTIIVYSADHGLAMGSHGLMGKQSLYDHSMKAPLIFTGPGIPRGRSEALAYLLDIFPTVCDLVGASVPNNLDGQSLAPIVAGMKRGVRESLFLSYRDVQRAVRDGRWKLIRYPQINKTQLFDLASDPDEMNNLADESQHAKRIEQLSAELARWQRELGDQLALTSDQPRDPTFAPPADTGVSPAKAQDKRPGKKRKQTAN